MKKTILLLNALLIMTFGFAQNEVELHFNTEKEVFLNQNKIDNTTELVFIKTILGEPVLYKEYPSGKATYHYPDLGISIELFNNQLTFIGVNYNWDGDKSFPEKTYLGNLKIDDISFDKDSNKSKLSEVKIVDIKCIMSGMCMTNPKEGKVSIIIGVKEENITQIGFGFK